ncbi:MFS transporter [Streptomyces sp. NPDC058220]|uniref:MFS transporter n=1 Tax=Streptomyces sp. NPDC058220 TaxID=3346387 RepID=UPI0036EF4975
MTVTPPSPAPPARHLRTARRAVSGYFFINGIAFSSWVARIPDIKHKMALSDVQLSLALLVASAGTVAGLTAIGPLVDRLGSARVSRAASIAVALGLTATGTAPDLPLLMAALLFFGLAGGAYNVSMNAQAVQVDREYGRPVIASIHAVFSAGALAGSGLGILTVELDIPPHTGLTALGALLVLAALACGHFTPPPTPPPTRTPTPRQSGRTLANSRVLFLGACCFACLLAEGAIADWSGVYLREHVLLTPALAPAGYLLFSAAMATGRLLADRAAVRLGPMKLVTLSALTSGTGLTLGLLTAHPLGALTGLTVFGLGLSCIMPQMFKAAGEQVPTDTGKAIATVAAFGYIGLLAGPALIGLLSHTLGLPRALGLLALLMLAMTLAAKTINTWQPPPPTPTPASPVPPAQPASPVPPARSQPGR